MNYDIMFYDTLTPLILAYKGYAGAIFASAFFVHWVRGAYAGSLKGHLKDGVSWWKTAVLSVLDRKSVV